MMNPFRVTFGIALVVLPLAALGQTTAPPVAAPKTVPSKQDSGNVVLRNSPTGTSIYDDNLQIAKLTKDVTVTQVGQDFILYCQELTYYRKTNSAIARGSLRIETRDSTLRGLELKADFNAKTFELTGNVSISTHGKDDGVTPEGANLSDQFKSKPSKIWGSRGTWDYELRSGTLTGNIRMKQEENSGTCNQINYEEEANVAELMGNVIFLDSKGNRFRAKSLIFDIDAGRIQPFGGVLDFKDTGNTGNTAPAKTRKPIGKVADISEEANRVIKSPTPLPTPEPEPTEKPLPTQRPDAPDDEAPAG